MRLMTLSALAALMITPALAQTQGSVGNSDPAMSNGGAMKSQDQSQDQLHSTNGSAVSISPTNDAMMNKDAQGAAMSGAGMGAATGAGSSSGNGNGR